jgi:Ni/Fe-hydrogenase b-type cytochrome subunit
MPQLLSSSTTLDGSLTTTDNGALFYEPDPGASGLYIIGSDSVTWVDWFGILSFLGVLVGVVAHGGLRAYAAYRNPAPKHEVEAVYMYTIYERFWHWLQTFAILLLIFTGLIIHKPAMFGAFSFAYVVVVHNVLGFLLTANAGLSLFYHLASGEIQQYIPKPRGFFNQAITQAKFYLQGIFKGAEHPFEKTVDRKLNPLQQVTYFAILNVLLPLQIVTGVLMWGAQRFPDFMAQIGGLTILAPFHTLVAWSFASFIVMHVYLTTTGHTPTAAIKAMMVGWDEVEVHNPPAAAD